MKFEFVLTDLTTDATPAAMKPAQCFARMVEAIGEDIAGPFSAEHGQFDFGFRIAAAPGDRVGNEIAAHFRDTIPEAPGALAYHQVTNGIPDIEIGVDLFDSLDGPGEGLIKGVDHEIKETMVDPGANQQADMGGANPMPKEVCDFVQNLARQKSNGAFVSAFLLQSAWIPGAPGPWDSEGAMVNQGDSSNGYDPSQPQSMSNLHPLAQSRKALPTSRKSRRAA